MSTRRLAAIVLLAAGTVAAEEPPGFDLTSHGPIPQPSAAQKTAYARLLTASCAACHGTNGASVGITPVLAGLGRDYFIRQMLDFKSGARPGTVMNRHAEGYTYQELEVMADFFSGTRRGDCGPAPTVPSHAIQPPAGS